jgi:hypothetical protein
MLSSARSSRRKKAVESFGSAADCIGTIEKDMALFAITRGQFSMLDAVNIVIQQVGICRVSVWTWAIADYEVECFEAFMANRTISSGRLIIDRSAEFRNAPMIQKWRSCFGGDSVRTCKNHAKIATVQNDEFRVLLRGSMNLNFNPRFEQLDITEGGQDFDLVERIENELPVLRPQPSNLEADNATQLGLAYETSTLKMFQGVKAWAK